MSAVLPGIPTRRIFTRSLPGWLPATLAALGLGLFLVQAAWYAHGIQTSLDEGAYLYNGYLFVKGIYKPFQAYGPWTNKGPLAFLIPGFVQFLFGPGLRAGRYFSIFLGLLTIAGTALTARRLANKWWAVVCAWIFALSPAIIKLYSVAVTEVIIACMLAWILFLVLGGDRPRGHLVLAAALASLVVLTRQNMIFFLPFLYAYMLWKHGWKNSAWALACGLAVLAAGHALYWPRIMSMWAEWLPRSVTPFLDAFRAPDANVTAWNPDIDGLSRLASFFQGGRHHFIFVASAVAVLLWVFSRKKGQKGSAEIIFLGSLYFALAAIHAWAAVGSDYETYSCVYCFSSYLGFFDPVGILLAVVFLSSLPAWQFNQNTAWLQTVVAIVFVVLFSAGMGLSMFGDVSKAMLSFPIPRLRAGQIMGGSTTFLEAVSNKFDLPFSLIRKYSAATLGLLAALLVLLLAYFLWRKYRHLFESYTRTLLVGYLVLGIALAPLLAGSESRVDCAADIIRQNEQLGRHLAETIPPGSQVYWDGGLSVIPLLYTRDKIRIFPPQMNDGYTFRIGGDADKLLSFGYWNEQLKQQWIASADIFIIEEWRYKDWKDILVPSRFMELPASSADASCEPDSGLRLFQRLP